MLHGIMGGRLFASGDIYEKNKLKYKQNQLLWIHTPQMNGFFRPTWNLPRRGAEIVRELDNILDENNKVIALRCHIDGSSVHPVAAADVDDMFSGHANNGEYGAAGTYTALVNALKTSLGKENAFFISYDWRMNITNTAQSLKPILNNLIDSYDEIYIIAHSLGGLVALEYITSLQNKGKIKLITIGTPFWGAPSALHILKTGKALPLNYCKSGIQQTAQNLSSVYELLPTRNYVERKPFINLRNGIIKAAKLLDADETAKFVRNTVENTFLLDKAINFHEQFNAAERFNNIESYAIIGRNKPTLTTLYARFENGLFPHETKSGDGTVPLISATMDGLIPESKISYFDETHSALPSNKKVIELILKKHLLLKI